MKDPIVNIKNALQEILQELDASAHIALERPVDTSHGDYSSNVSFTVAKQINKSPLDCAMLIAQKLTEKAIPEVKQVDAVKPGFINIWLSEKFLIEKMSQIAQ